LRSERDVTLLVVALALTAIMVAVIVARSVRADSSRAESRPVRPDGEAELWLGCADRLVLEAARVSADIAAIMATGPISALGDAALTSTTQELDELCVSTAALSATAPTTMDRRVVRGLGVQARALGDLLVREQQLRAADVPVSRIAGRDSVRELPKRVHQLELAIDDLKAHVQLL
jgi:hypothetical protein